MAHSDTGLTAAPRQASAAQTDQLVDSATEAAAHQAKGAGIRPIDTAEHILTAVRSAAPEPRLRRLVRRPAAVSSSCPPPSTPPSGATPGVRTASTASRLVVFGGSVGQVCGDLGRRSGPTERGRPRDARHVGHGGPRARVAVQRIEDTAAVVAVLLATTPRLLSGRDEIGSDVPGLVRRGHQPVQRLALGLAQLRALCHTCSLPHACAVPIAEFLSDDYRSTCGTLSFCTSASRPPAVPLPLRAGWVSTRGDTP